MKETPYEKRIVNSFQIVIKEQMQISASSSPLPQKRDKNKPYPKLDTQLGVPVGHDLVRSRDG